MLKKMEMVKIIETLQKKKSEIIEEKTQNATLLTLEIFGILKV